MKHMTKEYADGMWENMLAHLQEDPEKRIMENPAADFREKAKAGMYDSMPDEEYEQELENVEQVSALFRRRRWATSYSLILRALQDMAFTAEERQALAELLAQAAAHTDFKKGVM